MYDNLIVGAGLFGATVAQTLAERGQSCLVIDRRGHIAGNVYTEKTEGVNVHRYGAHIFQIPRWPTTGGNCTPCRSTCIPSTECGEW